MPHQQVLSLCMIVRDEEKNLARCLSSICDEVDEIIIVDTGSVDHTIEIAQSFGAKVYQYQWSGDFSLARNYSLQMASGDWILVLDADDQIRNGDQGRIRPLMQGDCDGYFFSTVSFVGEQPGVNAVYSPFLRMFKKIREHNYTGAVHELIPLYESKRYSYQDVTVFHYGYLDSEVKRQQKIRRNLDITLREANLTPASPVIFYNLGTEYLRHGSYFKAIASYQKSLKLIDDPAAISPEIFKKLALCFAKIKKIRTALKVLEEGIKYHPQYTDLYYLRGCYAQEIGSVSLGLASFEHCLSLGEPPPYYPAEIGTGSFKALFGMGVIHQMQYNYPAAVEALIRSWEINPGFNTVIFPLVETLVAWKGKDFAQKYLEQRLTPGQDLLRTLADAFSNLGLYDATYYYLMKLENPPSFLLGICLQALGQRPAAERQFKQSVKENSFVASSLLHIILVNWLDRKYELAVQNITQLKKCRGWRCKSRVLSCLTVFLQSGQDHDQTLPRLSAQEWDLLANLYHKLVEMREYNTAFRCWEFMQLASITPDRVKALLAILWKHNLYYQAAVLLEHIGTSALVDQPLDMAENYFYTGHTANAIRFYQRPNTRDCSLKYYLNYARALELQAYAVARGEL